MFPVAETFDTPPPRARRIGIAAALLAAGILAAPPPAHAQSSTAPNVEPRNYPPALPPRKGPPPPRLKFDLRVTIPISGRLAGGPPVPESGGARVPLDGGTAHCELEPGSEARVEPGATVSGEAAEPVWSVSADGSHRFRAASPARIVAQRKCRFCRSGWKDDWSLRAATSGALPVVHDRSVFTGTLDGRVLGLRADNGHRLWAVDVGDRVSKPIAVWTGQVARAEGGTADVALLLVATDAGGSLLALDVFDGSRLGTFDLPPAEGRLATAPAVTPDGRILVGRARYAADEADLLVLSLAPADPPPRNQGADDHERDKLTPPAGGR